MTRRKIDILFIIFSLISFLVFVSGYHSFNSSKKYELPHIAGNFDGWGVTLCEFGDGCRGMNLKVLLIN